MSPPIKKVEYLVNRINGEYFYTAWRGVRNVSENYKEELEMLNLICQ